MWQNWKLNSESSLGNVKHRHLPVEVLPAPTAALHGAAGQEASAQPPPAGATASPAGTPASRADPKPAVQAAARGRQLLRQAGSCHGDSRRCAHGSSWLPAEGLEPPSPSRAPGALLQRACSLHVSVTCWGVSQHLNPSTSQEITLTGSILTAPVPSRGPLLQLSPRLAPMCGFGGRTQHSAHSKGTCGQGAREKLGREQVSGTIGQLTPRDHTYTYKLETHTQQNCFKKDTQGRNQYGDTSALRPQRGERFLKVRWKDRVGWGASAVGWVWRRHEGPHGTHSSQPGRSSMGQAMCRGRLCRKAQCRSK